jgi:DNA-binding NarL/FixJ family response regulator
VRGLLADDDAHVVSALRLLLEDEPGVIIVGDCDAADKLVELASAGDASVVLLDWELPGLQGGDALATLRFALPGCQLLALSGRPEHRAEALRAGARGFVCKGDAPDSLLSALHTLVPDHPQTQAAD